MNLECRLQSCRQEKHNLEEYIERVVEELEQELLDANQTNTALLENLKTASASVQPDYEAARDRALAKLKMGKQSTAGKAIDAFIKELKHSL